MDQPKIERMLRLMKMMSGNINYVGLAKEIKDIESPEFDKYVRRFVRFWTSIRMSFRISLTRS